MGYVHPVAAALVGSLLWLVVWHGGAISMPELPNEMRPFPLLTRFDVSVAMPISILLAALVSAPLEARVRRWVTAILGVIGLGVAVFIPIEIARIGSASSWALIDIGIAIAASAALFARGEPRPWSMAIVLSLVLVSASWTFVATEPTARYAGEEVAEVGLEAYFATDSQLVCTGDWHVVPFPDRDRCLPREPMVTIGPREVLRLEVGPNGVGDRPRITLTLSRAASERLESAIAQTVGHRLVLLNRDGELVFDGAVPFAVPGPTFVLDFHEDEAELERTLSALLGQS